MTIRGGTRPSTKINDIQGATCLYHSDQKEKYIEGVVGRKNITDNFSKSHYKIKYIFRDAYNSKIECGVFEDASALFLFII